MIGPIGWRFRLCDNNTIADKIFSVLHIFLGNCTLYAQVITFCFWLISLVSLLVTIEMLSTVIYWLCILFSHYLKSILIRFFCRSKCKYFYLTWFVKKYRRWFLETVKLSIWKTVQTLSTVRSDPLIFLTITRPVSIWFGTRVTPCVLYTMYEIRFEQ